MDFLEYSLALGLEKFFEPGKSIYGADNLFELLEREFITLEHLSDSFLVKFNSVLFEQVDYFVEVKTA
jgi:hypothetical protein